jgi:DNA-binding Xre family transcriptional regulator
MLRFEASRGFHLRGIENPISFMMKNGINRSTASNLYRGQVELLRLEHLEKLCSLLRCTPNDLLSWTPNAKAPQDEDHPLQALKRDRPAKNIAEIASKLPLEKLDRLETILEELRNE